MLPRRYNAGTSIRRRKLTSNRQKRGKRLLRLYNPSIVTGYLSRKELLENGSLELLSTSSICFTICKGILISLDMSTQRNSKGKSTEQ